MELNTNLGILALVCARMFAKVRESAKRWL
jgi:hypothetical protein